MADAEASPAQTLHVPAAPSPHLSNEKASRHGHGHHGVADVLHDIESRLEDEVHEAEEAFRKDAHTLRLLWHRFRGVDRWVPWGKSFKNIALSSPLNILIVVLPIAWASHIHHWNENVTFALCFLAIIPLEQMFDFLGEQMMFYLGKSLGDLLIITLNNAVEATLAIILLTKCELRILQASVAGVVLLHLLLIPGTAFLTGGARILEQNLHAHPTQLNHSLLTIGVLSILVPTAFFSALDRGALSAELVNDMRRGEFLSMSRAAAIILLIIYCASRAYMYDPPGDGNALVPINAPPEIIEEEEHLARAMPDVNVWAACATIAVTVALVAVTAEFLVESIEHFRVRDPQDESIEHSRTHALQDEWFGLILLPLVSFAADGAVATIFFVRYMFGLFFGRPEPPAQLAKGRSIDMSIQFTIFWLPFFVLLGWWTNKPLTMLFDLYEVTLLLGACFLVNTVTADAKTNWIEGLTLVGLYALIATASWWYPGQEATELMLACGNVVLTEAGGEGGEGLARLVLG